MARTKTRRAPNPKPTTAAHPPPPPPPPPQQPSSFILNKKQEEEEADEEEEEKSLASLISLLASSISQTLHFLSSSDLLLLPSHSLSLSSLLRSSSLSLSSILSSSDLSTSRGMISSFSSSSSTCSSSSWFRRFVASSTSPSDPRWVLHFRMSKPSFYLLLQTLSPSLPSPADHSLAAALFRLAHAAPFPFLARRFSLPSPSLACRSFYLVTRAISRSLSHLFELSSDLPRILHSFRWLSLPNCAGVLSFLRLPIRSSSSASPSITAQCLVDSEGRFLDVSVGWLSFMSPHQILLKTKLYTTQSSFLSSNPNSNANVANVGVGNSTSNSNLRYFIGGSCCPLLPWLLTPYRGRGGSLNQKEAAFNLVHARGMELAERAFKNLKARWKILRMEWREECAEALPYVFVATCLLHNFLVKCSEPVVVEEEEEESEGEEVAGFGDFDGEDDEHGERMRNVIALHLTQVMHK